MILLRISGATTRLCWRIVVGREIRVSSCGNIPLYGEL